MKEALQQPIARIGVGAAALALVAVFAAAFYIFGGNGASGGGTTQAGGASPTLTTPAHGSIFTIDSSSSQVTFTIDETLFGQPNTVVGKTSQVSGQIAVDTSDPSKSQVGQIKVDLSALATDNDLRNRTLQNRILETGASGNQFAIFTAKSLSGLSTSVTAGQTVAFKITGDLAIHGVTKSVIFDAEVTPTSATQLTGKAQATVKYKDFGIAIPNVPSVSNVSDNVKLAITFTAKA